MARSIGGDGSENRDHAHPRAAAAAGPILFLVSIVGLWRLERDPTLRPFRALGTTFLAILAVVFASGGKSYYVAGALPVLMAAGAIAVDRWIVRGTVAAPRRSSRRPRARSPSSRVLTLPVLPASTLAATPIPDLYPENAEQVGWPELVSSVRTVVDALPRTSATGRSSSPPTTASRERSSSSARACRRSTRATTARGPGVRRPTTGTS